MNKAMLLKQYLSYHKKSSARLPSAYQEVEYIESTGTQYIDSGYNINDNKVKIQIKFRITDWNESGFYFGCGNVSTSNAFTASTSYLAIGSNTISAFPNQDSMVGVINELEMEANESTKKYSFSIINGIRGTGSYSGTIKSNLSMPIFKGTVYSGCCDCRVYSFRLYANDVLVRDFIPCYRKSDNEVGLYDIVNNQFYTNQGTGTFLYGRPLVNIDGYEQLDYIESSGTQYIDTKIKPHNLETMIDFQYISRNGTTDNWLLGVYGGNDERYYALNLDTASHLLGFDTTGNTTFSYARSPYSLNRHKLIFNEYNTHKIYLDGNVISGTAPTITNSANNIYLWSFSEGQSGIRYSSIARIYYCTMKENGVLIRNLIPMRRLSDNELGLYDLVNGVFYTNQGSGSFIAGEFLKA